MKKRKKIVASAIVTGALVMQGTLGDAQSGAAANSPSGDAVRPFHVYVSDTELADLRGRIKATKWPERELGTDQSEGVQMARMQKLANYWATDYDWRKVEAKLNALPQFMTTIDGLDIYFIHVRSKNKNALPIIITHGWPGSVIEQLKIIGPLTDPTASGGKAEDAFTQLIPSFPPHALSTTPHAPLSLPAPPPPP